MTDRRATPYGRRPPRPREVGLRIAKVYGGSKGGAYVAVPIGLVQLSMTIDDHPSGDLYDVYDWEDEIHLKGRGTRYRS